MIDRKKFFDNVKISLFHGKFTQSQVDGLTSILDSCENYQPELIKQQIAYMLATTFHETAATMQPIEEYGKGRGRLYGKNVKLSGMHYVDTKNIFYGRGYVQLTWYENYLKAGKELGIDLINHPEKALEPLIAAKIMILGMTKGWFTGRKLINYFDGRVESPTQARRIINSLDKADLVASYYYKFLKALS